MSARADSHADSQACWQIKAVLSGIQPEQDLFDGIKAANPLDRQLEKSHGSLLATMTFRPEFCSGP